MVLFFVRHRHDWPGVCINLDTRVTRRRRKRCCIGSGCGLGLPMIQASGLTWLWRWMIGFRNVQAAMIENMKVALTKGHSPQMLSHFCDLFDCCVYFCHVGKRCSSSWRDHVLPDMFGLASSISWLEWYDVSHSPSLYRIVQIQYIYIYMQVLCIYIYIHVYVIYVFFKYLSSISCLVCVGAKQLKHLLTSLPDNCWWTSWRKRKQSGDLSWPTLSHPVIFGIPQL